MLDDTIRAFLLAARLGSFSQAARELYLTPNAVKKRVEALERQTGLTLFERSNHGLVLTPAGTSLATDLRSVSRQLERAVADARAIQERRAGTVWLGISATFAEELLSSRWPGVEHFVGATATRIVHYGPTPRDRDEMLRDVGVRTDLCVDLFEPQLAPVNGLRAWEISRFRLCLASVDTDREVGGDLELANVSTRAVALLPIGRSRAVDAVPTRLRRAHLGRAARSELRRSRARKRCRAVPAPLVSPARGHATRLLWSLRNTRTQRGVARARCQPLRNQELLAGAGRAEPTAPTAPPRGSGP